MVHDLSARADLQSLTALFGDDIDYACYGFATVESTCRPTEYLYALNVFEAYAAPSVVAADAPAIFEDEEIVVAHTVEIDETAHAVGVSGDVGRELAEGILHTCCLHVSDVFGRDDFHGHGSIVGSMVCACCCHDDRIEHGSTERVALGLAAYGYNKDGCQGHQRPFPHFVCHTLVGIELAS